MSAPPPDLQDSAASQDADAQAEGPRDKPERERSVVAALALGALGVVFGDIGTSPLYSLKECFNGPHGVPATPENVVGILSLVFWSLTFVVTFKYITFVMRADNRGEGGVLALMALVGQRGGGRTAKKMLLLMGLFGACLLYGDGVITPAISVLGAIEGLSIAAPGLSHFVVPLTVVVLVALFVIQKGGTAKVGLVFGPIMLIWFLCISVAGIRGIWIEPRILWALSPIPAARFFVHHGLHAFLVLGGVVLVITGGEALYADMGHFGRRPIKLAWLGLAMPALLLNYFGQGAMLLVEPEVARNPFYLLLPAWAVYPMVGVATAAAIVASQALISGAFSLTNQAVQLGYCPRVTIRHTSSTEYGQIYIPEVNGALAAACIALVLGFKTSSALASAYGVAVTGTMAITTLLFHRVARDRWRWPWWVAWPLTILFLSVDLPFFSANAVKIEAGGWFPIAAGVLVYLGMSTWKAGRTFLEIQLKSAGLPIELFAEELVRAPPQRIPGTAVFMTAQGDNIPPVMLHHLKHNKVLHERVLLVAIKTEEIPSVPQGERATVRAFPGGLYQVFGRYGFMETPNVPALLASLPRGAVAGPRIEQVPLETTYYLGRDSLLPTGKAKMARWRKRLFIRMARNARTASDFFGLPPNRVVEMGGQIQL